MSWDELYSAITGWRGTEAVLIFVAGFALARVLRFLVQRFTASRFSPQLVMVLRRLVFYTIMGFTITSALGAFDIDLSVLIGAAGVLSVAIGFASQTSASNLISGIFLIGERPFAMGDVIRVGETVGEVLSIDWLSVKIRTFDNLFVRVPNETLIKSQIQNLSYFPIRRVDLKMRIGLHEDIGRVKTLLNEVAKANTSCLNEPKPLFLLQGFSELGRELQFSVWGARENFIVLGNSMQEDIHKAFMAQNIEVPMPQRALHVRPNAVPLQVTLVSSVNPEEVVTQGEPSS